jgi:hypothetical protein
MGPLWHRLPAQPANGFWGQLAATFGPVHEEQLWDLWVVAVHEGREDHAVAIIRAVLQLRRGQGWNLVAVWAWIGTCRPQLGNGGCESFVEDMGNGWKRIGCTFHAGREGDYLELTHDFDLGDGAQPVMHWTTPEAGDFTLTCFVHPGHPENPATGPDGSSLPEILRSPAPEGPQAWGPQVAHATLTATPLNWLPDGALIDPGAENLYRATGADLDRMGAMLGLQRAERFEMIHTPCPRAGPSQEPAAAHRLETDAEFRERLTRIVRGDRHGDVDL